MKFLANCSEEDVDRVITEMTRMYPNHQIIVGEPKFCENSRIANNIIGIYAVPKKRGNEYSKKH